MNFDFLPEPELEFGNGGRHIDIRFGLAVHGPLDVDKSVAPRSIRIGLVGTPEHVEGVRAWLDRCRNEIPAKRSRQPNLFRSFPGFNEEGAFRSTLILDGGLTRSVPNRVFDELLAGADHNSAVTAATEMFLSEFAAIKEQRPVDVLLCAVPMQLVALMDPDTRPAEDGVEKRRTKELLDFHDMLKARAMSIDTPVQLILPQTFDPTTARRQKIKSSKLRMPQDDATRAWNFHTALYYKAMGRPWRLIRDHAQLTTCYVGISFYYSLDRSKIMTSMAQVFDERGEGIIVRGGPVKISKEDRIPHLDETGAGMLLGLALNKYRDVHGNLPARIVLHKTSPFDAAELRGFSAAASAKGIGSLDAVSVTAGSPVRAFRDGAYPPLRGTLLRLDDRHHLLYLKGSVDFFQTYPGPYIPKPFGFRCDQVEETPLVLAKEILALSKMNWNDTQFDGGSPITVTAARKVAGIMKYIGDRDPIAWRYSHYM